MAKKHNKSRQQKPNYSKQGVTNVNVEAGADLDMEKKIMDKNCISSDNSICERTSKNK